MKKHQNHISKRTAFAVKNEKLYVIPTHFLFQINSL